MLCAEKTRLESESVKEDSRIHLEEDISFCDYESLGRISSEWKSFTKDLPIFFSYEFLTAVENCPPSGLRNRYLICYKGDKVYGIILCQLKDFHGIESIKFKEKPGVVNKVSTSFKKGFARMLNFEGIVCGSVLLTGSYAFRFFDSKLSHKDQFLLAEKLVERYRKKLNGEGHKLKVTFIKDFYEDKKFEDQEISESLYKEFSVQPNMILRIRPTWKSYDDYLQAFQSKYRVRAKRARKKFKGIEKRELDYVEIKKYNTEIYKLYRNIVDAINFNLFFLHEDYFAELKKQLKNKYKLFGYFKGEKLVAFYTCIDNGDEMNAHFLGYDPAENKNHQLYLNSLYDMVEVSISHQFKTINFSRTAMEIKSSMGAEPYDMLCYLKHQNKLINTSVAKIVGALNPTEEWVQRRPFKEDKS